MKDNRDVVIVSAVRTPFGRFDGIAREIPSIDLGIAAICGGLGQGESLLLSV
ncbi:MAG: hypothetical protein JRJ82_03125 [Deltaproteobacteria bacterium]|nr:hypothetical protein [Deltaproteobacteria bacterium]